MTAGVGPRLSTADAAAFEDCIRSGGVAVFPADTVYGLACDPAAEAAVTRLYDLKGRSPDTPAAVMFFRVEDALASFPELGGRTGAALRRLLPGPVTLVLPNAARRFPLACGPEPERVGLRVPRLPERLGALRELELPVLQSSANRSGGPEARRIEELDPAIAAGADLSLDGGELPGEPSTVIDLTAFEEGGGFSILRAGAVPEARVAQMLSG